MLENGSSISDEELEELLTPPGNIDDLDDGIKVESDSNDAVKPTQSDDVLDSTKLNVPLLVSNIEKYYLGGLINKSLYTSDDKLSIVGADESKSIYAVVSSRRKLFNKKLEFGIFDTSQMLNLLGLFTGEATLDITDNTFNLSQNEVDVEISLADSGVINGKNFKAPSPEKHFQEYDIDLTLTRDIMDKILKSISAFPTSEKNFYFTFKRNKPKLVIGDDASKSNKVNIDISELGTVKQFDGKMAFFIKYLKQVISAVKGMDKVTMKMSIAGVLVVEATDENYTCRYFMGADSEQSTIK